MKRAAITIIYEGLHHLHHKQMTEKMIAMFDYWIIVEGYSRNGGSSKHLNIVTDFARSTDGTIEYCEQLASDHKGKVFFYSSKLGWPSKDDQFSAGIDMLSCISDECYLWQIDADEQWNEDQLSEAEAMLFDSDFSAASFQFHQFIGIDALGNQLVARGNWGSAFVTRLWKWQGEQFISHCPPVMMGQSVIKLPQVYDHYSYQFRKDVMLKSRLYKGYRIIARRWDRLLANSHRYPIPLSALFGFVKGTNKSYIYVHKENVESEKLAIS